MKDVIIRIQRIELENFKNIGRGIIENISYKKKNYYEGYGDIVGIYGQNGSGKTAVIESLELFQKIASGEKLPIDIGNFIYKDQEESKLKFVFYIERKDEKFLVYYEIFIKKNENQPQLYGEKLSYSKIINGKRSRKSDIIDYNINKNDIPLYPKTRYSELINNNKENEFNIEVLKRLAYKDKTSLVFNDDLREIFRSSSSNIDYSNIIGAIKHFAKFNLFVITNKHSAPISLNFIPLTFRMETEDSISYGEILINLLDKSDINMDEYEIVLKIIEQLNLVLDKIIPGLKLEVKRLGNELNRDGEEKIRIELVSIRNNFKIPLKYESEGIKKIISILSALISMFNNPTICLVVDELDSGIFEYLLGELLRIIEQQGKGQFIFTSHNLRALEMIDKNSLIFSTTNPYNRFVRLSNIKSNNNLRNVYLRGIDLGGLDENIYEETNSFEIARAFRKAGEISGPA